MLLFSFYLCYCCDNALLLCYFLLCYWSGFINYNANSQNINGCAFSYAKWYSKNASCSLKLIYMTCLMDAVVKKTKRIKYINLLVLSLTDNCHLCFSIFFHGHINYVRWRLLFSFHINTSTHNWRSFKEYLMPGFA
jgi:hypothetical protein